MASFDPTSLSPRPIEPEALDLPFDLRWPDLAPALPGFAGDRSAECAVTRRFQLQGLHDRTGSTPVTLRYPVASRLVEEVDLFIKRTSALEAQWYGLLAEHSVPVPALLAQVERDDHVVLVLEFLKSVGVHFDAPAEVDELLQLVAGLNAMCLDDLDDRHLAPPGLPEAEFTAMVQQALDSMSRLPGLARLHIDPQTWFAAYLNVRDRSTRMPTAVTHGEFYFQQVGRTSTGVLVVLDLETMGIRPRFSDISSILGPLADRTGAEEKVHLSTYIGALAARAIDSPGIDDAYTELRCLRIDRAFQSLPWLARAHNDPEIGFGMLAQRVETIRQDLQYLALA